MIWYHMQKILNPELRGTVVVSAPEAKDLVAQQIKDILELNGVTSVAVFYDKGLGMRAELFHRVEESDTNQSAKP